MFMIFDCEGALVAVVTMRGGETTTILEVLEDAGFGIKRVETEDQLSKE